jgi:putative oxidoreductase
MKYIVLLGRILFSSIFIIKGFDHFFSKTIESVSGMGVPAAGVLVPLGGVICILGGLSILLGYRTRFGAWLLVAFLVPTTFAMHRFWEIADEPLNMLHNYCFMKNLSLLGAVLLVAYFGSGPLSLCSSCCKENKK